MRKPSGLAENRPGEPAALGHTDIQTNGVDRALIGLRRTRNRPERAFHRLMAEDDEADAGIEPAPEHTGLGPGRRLGISRRGHQSRKNKQSRQQKQSQMM